MCFGKSYIEKNYYIIRKSHNTVPQPPHVAVLVGKKTVGVVAAVLDIVESAAVDGCSRVPRSGAGESVHERTVGTAVGAAFTHAGKKNSPVAAGQRGDEDWHIFASAPLLKKGKKDGGADSGEVDLSLTPSLPLARSARRSTHHRWLNEARQLIINLLKHWARNFELLIKWYLTTYF